MSSNTTPWIPNFKTLSSSRPREQSPWANMGPTWVLSVPDGPHVGPMNLAIRDVKDEINHATHNGSRPCNLFSSVLWRLVFSAWIENIIFCLLFRSIYRMFVQHNFLCIVLMWNSDKTNTHTHTHIYIYIYIYIYITLHGEHSMTRKMWLLLLFFRV